MPDPRIARRKGELCDDALDTLMDVIQEAKPLGDSTVSPWLLSEHERIEKAARDLRHDIMAVEENADRRHNA